VVGLGLLVPALGRIPFRRGEIYFADAARAMVESGDWLVPHYQSAPFFDKPILTYWLMAGSFSVFGFSTGAARIPSILATVAALLVTLWLGRMLWPDHTGLAAGFVLAATPSFLDFGRLAMSDALLTLWSALVVALVVHLHRTERTFWPTVLLGGVLGLGFLTKGPIAWITPGLGAACFMAFQRGRRPAIFPAAWVLASAVATSIALGWFVAVYLRMGWEPLAHFFLRENFARFSGGSHDIGNPIWFYPQTYLHEGAPWSVFLPLAAAYFFWRAPDNSCRWLMAWILLDVLLLSASQGKIGYYLLPLYPAASLVIARYVVVARWGRFAKGLLMAVLVLAAFALGLVPLALARVPSGWLPDGVALVAVIAAFAACAVACVAAVIGSRAPRMPGVLVTVSIVTFALTESVIMPAFYEGQPNHAIAEQTRRELERHPDARVAARHDFAAMSRELLFESRLRLDEGADLAALAKSNGRYLLIAGAEDATTLETIPQVRKIAEYPYMPVAYFSRRGLVSRIEPQRLFLFANFQ
jgi:4-amino-4-deoxy-L-arabinose transferase-like glycosyltransferase